MKKYFQHFSFFDQAKKFTDKSSITPYVKGGTTNNKTIYFYNQEYFNLLNPLNLQQRTRPFR